MFRHWASPFRWHHLLLCLAAVGHPLFVHAASSPTPNQPQPFLHLRQSTLDYHGPDTDLTNLTELRIAWFGPTNLNDPLTGDLWWAANLAIHEANNQRCRIADPEPKNRNISIESERSLPFRLVPVWSEDPWGSGASQLVRMVYEQQPLALIGSVDSASTHLAEQIATKANLPLVSPISTDPSITLAGVSWMFSCAPSDAAIARALADDVLATVIGAEDRLVLLVSTDHESRMVATEVLKQLHRHHRSPGFCFTVPAGSRDFSSQIPAWIAASPAAVIILAGVDDAARLTLTLRNLFPLQHGSSTCQIFGSHSMGRRSFLDLVGQVAEGVRFPLLVPQDPENPALSEFIARFSAERGRTPDYTALLAYDAMRLLIEAIHQAGPNRARIRLALAQASPWSGIAGPITFDGTGQNTHSTIQPAVIRDGQVRTLRVLECGSPLPLWPPTSHPAINPRTGCGVTPAGSGRREAIDCAR
jgi:branched-chain amino acid transport system substrate-binding protein